MLSFLNISGSKENTNISEEDGDGYGEEKENEYEKRNAKSENVESCAEMRRINSHICQAKYFALN